MKALTVFFILALTASSAVQAQTMKDAQATYDLAGPVRTFRTEVATFILEDGRYVEGPRMLRMGATFNEDGNRTELNIYDDKGVLTRRIVERFDGKRMTEFLNYDGAGRMWLRGTAAYEDDGKIKEKATFNGDGSLRSKTIYKRDNQGQLIESAEYSSNGVLMEKSTSA